MCSSKDTDSRMKERGLGWNHLVGYCDTAGERENEPELIGWFGEREGTCERDLGLV